MKKLLGISLIVLGATFGAQGACNTSCDTSCNTSSSCSPCDVSCDTACDPKGITSDVSGHTFLSIRRPFIAALPEVVSGPWRGAAFRRDCGIGGAVQVVPFGGRSTNSKDLGRYFMFCNKDRLFASNFDQADTAARPDINPRQFNIVSTGETFSSCVQFRPRHSFVGVGLQYRQYLGYNECCERKWFLDINTAVVRVQNNLNCCEVVSSGTVVEGSATGICDALTGNKPYINADGSIGTNRLLYGKVCGKQKRTRLQDIELKLGYQYVCTDECHFLAYAGLDIPTGNKPNAEYLFEAVVGNNQHVGIMTGMEAGFELWRDCDRSLWWEINGNSRYYIRNTQRRLIPLKNRQWSQYMLAFASDDDAAAGTVTPAANLLARQVKVSPRYAVNINSGLVYASCGFQGEIGYNFWARQSEKLSLKDDCNTSCGTTASTSNQYIAALASNGDILNGNTNRLSNIGDNNSGANLAIVDAALQAINVCDLDLNKAAAPCAMSHTVYGSLGYCFDWCMPTFVALGGSYEFTGVNTAISRWTVWGKFGVSI